MKKVLLAAALVLNGSLVFAQVIDKDKRILGGSINLGFNHHQADTLASSKPSIKGSTISFGVAPSFGKAVKNNLVFGYLLSLNYSHSKSEDLRLDETGTNNGYGLGTGVFLEKYFPLSKALSFSVSMPFQVYYSSFESKLYEKGTLTQTGRDKYYGGFVALYPSLNYSVSKRFILQLTLNNSVSLGYSHSTDEIEGLNTISNKQESSNFGFNATVNQQTRVSDMSFAFRYIF